MQLNLDAGELDSETEALWSLFDVLACACGGHAGDMASMTRVAQFCARTGIRLAAHPSYPDREGFGRRSIAVTDLSAVLAGQIATLATVGHAAGVGLVAVKPHGALYHDAARDPVIADAVLAASDVPIIGPPSGALHDAARRIGRAYLREGFADRRLHADGSLVARSEPDALITDPSRAAQQALQLDVDTICIHADTPNAIDIARAVRAALQGRR